MSNNLFTVDFFHNMTSLITKISSQLSFIHRQFLSQRFQVHGNFSPTEAKFRIQLKSVLDRFGLHVTSCVALSYEFIESRRRETFWVALDPIKIHKFPQIEIHKFLILLLSWKRWIIFARWYRSKVLCFILTFVGVCDDKLT